MDAPAAHKRQNAARRETFGRRRRIRGHVGYLAGRSDKRLSRLESFSRRSSFDGYGGLFPDESFALRKIHGIKAQVSAVSGLRQSHAHKVAVHHPAQVCRDISQQFPQIQRGNHAIGQIQQKFQLLLRFSRSLEIQGVVGRQRDLVGNQREKRHVFLGKSVRLFAAEKENTEPAMHRGQRKGAARSHAASFDCVDRLAKARVAVHTGDHHSALILIHPPGYCFFFGYFLAGPIPHLLAFFGEMPGDLIPRFVVLNDPDAVELDDAAEFLPEHHE